MTESMYGVRIGVEAHVTLNTKEKLFCTCVNTKGEAPNSSCCAVCKKEDMADMQVNREAVAQFLKAAKLLHCTLGDVLTFTRRYYDGPDMAGGYQLTQQTPVCVGGWLDLHHTRYGIQKILLEEDSAKVFFRDGQLLYDYNRCGVPLIEVVSEPVFESGEEAVAFLRALRALLMGNALTRGRMEWGEYRSDVNLSLLYQGVQCGEIIEIKNVNSFRDIQRAVQYETEQLIHCHKEGIEIQKRVMRYDQKNKKTCFLRGLSHNRFQQEPGIQPIRIRDMQDV
ncbi:MAG: hypothetical protein ACOYJC_01950 [Christensenellales bacterium]|jgi:aspartyl-tRNA(Asn)/glutamyl-tRNA(Gln) amidotransferase subunit B